MDSPHKRAEMKSFLSCVPEQLIKQTVKLPVVWYAMTLTLNLNKYIKKKVFIRNKVFEVFVCKKPTVLYGFGVFHGKYKPQYARDFHPHTPR